MLWTTRGTLLVTCYNIEGYIQQQSLNSIAIYFLILMTKKKVSDLLYYFDFALIFVLFYWFKKEMSLFLNFVVEM